MDSQIIGLNNVIESKIKLPIFMQNVTNNHSIQVSRYALELGMKLGCSEEELNHLIVGGYMHDIGKFNFDDDILRGCKNLTDRQMEQIHNHTIMGVSIIANYDIPEEVKEIILLHHERVDGTGYPYQLYGFEIPKLVKIVSIADAYSAMTSNRGYRQALTKMEAIESLIENKDSQFYGEFVDAFIEVLNEKSI